MSLRVAPRAGVRARAQLAAAISIALVVIGCGFNVRSPDLFVLTRTGEGPRLNLLVSDGGTIRCNGAKAKPISDPLLISARDLSVDLAGDASAKLTIAPRPGTVFYYRIRLEQGTVSFPDRAAAGRKPLREAEQFALRAAQQACGLSG